MYRKFFSFLALCVPFLTSCELHEPAETAPNLAGRPANCPPEVRQFDLEYAALSSNAYSVTLETGPFIVKECMCKVFKYELYVSLNSAGQWNLVLPQGQILPFAPSVFGQHDLLSITDMDLILASIGSQSSGQLKATVDLADPVPNATLNAASGLCIIENYDGNGANGFPVGSTATGPVVVLQPTQVQGVFVVKIYIPIEITDAI